MPTLHSRDVRIWDELRAQIEAAGLHTEEIDWQLGTSDSAGRVTCTLTPVEMKHHAFPFSGTKAELDHLLNFIRALRARPALEAVIEPRPTDYRIERLAAIVCPVCGTPARVGRTVHATRGGKHGALVKCGNPHCLSIFFAGDNGPIETVVRASASSALATHLYAVGGDAADEQGTPAGERDAPRPAGDPPLREPS